MYLALNLHLSCIYLAPDSFFCIFILFIGFFRLVVFCFVLFFHIVRENPQPSDFCPKRSDFCPRRSDFFPKPIKFSDDFSKNACEAAGAYEGCAASGATGTFETAEVSGVFAIASGR